MVGKGLAICGVLFLLLGSSSSSLAMNQEPTNATSFSETIYVDDDNTEGPWDGSLEHPYQHIQDGIDNSSTGDTVFVFAGYYVEKINITKTLNLIGENNATTIISYNVRGGYNAVINLYSDGIVFSDFTVKITSSEGCGIILRQISNCKLKNNTFQAYWGVILDRSSDTEICHNLFQTSGFGVRIGWYDNITASFNNVHHNHFINTGETPSLANCGIFLKKTATQNTISDNLFSYCRSAGIIVEESRDNIIERNVIIGNNKTWNGIDMSWEINPAFNGNIIRQNLIKECNVGISTSTDGHIIDNNTIINTTLGLSLNFGPRNIIVRNNIIKGCTIGQNTWYADRGVIFEGNLYESNQYGVIIDYSNNLTYTKNTIKNNEIGVLGLCSLKCNVTRNNFLNNRIDAFMILSQCTWMRNYWDRPRILPKPIFGILPFIRFDLMPALRPSTMSSST